MATLQTADGRLLRRSAPTGSMLTGGRLMPGSFAPMWSNGERESNGLTDGGFLVSYENIYRSQAIIAGVVDKLSRRIATLPFDSYRRLDDGSSEISRGDSLDTLLRRPWPRAGTVHLNVHVALSLLVHGNAVVAKLRTRDREQPPFMLWPLDWAQLSAYAPQGGRIEWWSTTQFDGEERYIPIEDTLHFAWPAPSGSEIGVSPIEKLGTTVQIEDAAQRYQTAQFRNANRPSLVVTVGQANLTPEQQASIHASIDRWHKGPDNAARTMLLSADSTATPVSMSPIEAALIDQRRLDHELVGMVYDMAGPLMNDLTHGTYSNVAEFLASLYRDVVPPWTTLMEQTYQAQLIDPEPAWLDRHTAFDFTDKLKGDPRELAETQKLRVETGLTSRNEERRVLNLPPDGDPNDPNNPANRLTANVNNQDTLDNMAGTSPTVGPQ
jgi:HK97 family phage portal protein